MEKINHFQISKFIIIALLITLVSILAYTTFYTNKMQQSNNPHHHCYIAPSPSNVSLTVCFTLPYKIQDAIINAPDAFINIEAILNNKKTFPNSFPPQIVAWVKYYDGTLSKEDFLNYVRNQNKANLWHTELFNVQQISTKELKTKNKNILAIYSKFKENYDKAPSYYTIGYFFIPDLNAILTIQIFTEDNIEQNIFAVNFLKTIEINYRLQ